jgi:hypothetical protein
MGKSTAAAPDYRGAAEATSASNKQNLASQTYANRPNQYTPWGSSTWDNQMVWDPATQQNVTQWSQNQTLDPKLQSALNSQMHLQQGKSDLAGGMMQRVGNEIGRPMNWKQFGDVKGMNWKQYGSPIGMSLAPYGQMKGLDYDPTQLRQRAEDDAYARQTSRLDPQFEQQREAMDIRLRNQGLSPGDQAYQAQMDTFNRGKGDAYEQARRGSTDIGRQEAQQLYGQQMGTSNFYNQMRGQAVNEGFRMNALQNQLRSQGRSEGLQANQYGNQQRQQQIAEEMQRRGFSLNEMNALLSGQQVNTPQFQSFGQSGRSPGTDYSSAMRDQSNFDQMQQQQQNSMFGNLLGAGMSAYTSGMFGGW